MKKKILFLLHIPPPVHGSSMVGKFIQESKLINDSFETKYINLGTSSSVDEIGKGGLNKLVKYVKIILQTMYQCIIFRPQIGYLAMTAKGGAFYKDVLIGFLLKFFGARLVIHFHNKGVVVNQHKKLDDFLYRKIFKNSKVILLSEYLYTDVNKYVLKKDVYYCPNGIPDLKIPKIRRVEKKCVELLFLSNLIESKGVVVLLQALQLLKKKNISFNCNFIGGEGDVTADQFKEKVTELDLMDNVNYLGKKYGNEKHEYFLKADVFVFPTFYHNETFGLVNLEAMQYELPVVSTFEGGIPDVVVDGETGFLVPQKNIEVLAEKLEELISDKNKRDKMGAKGKEMFYNRFTLAHFEKKLTAILDKI